MEIKQLFLQQDFFFSWFGLRGQYSENKLSVGIMFFFFFFKLLPLSLTVISQADRAFKKLLFNSIVDTLVIDENGKRSVRSTLMFLVGILPIDWSFEHTGII